MAIGPSWPSWPAAGLERAAAPTIDSQIVPGDIVFLKAGGGPMHVLQVKGGCDGTGGDGAGLYCLWTERDGLTRCKSGVGWISESSVKKLKEGQFYTGWWT